MKKALLTLVGTAFLLGLPLAAAGDAQAHKSKKRHWHSSYDDRDQPIRGRRYFTQREIDTLPVRITRPPNTSHYIFDDYPAWAARAFERPQNR